MGLREKRKEERRQRILESARTLILRGGVEGLSMRELAAESGVTVPTLYNLIGSKVEIIYELHNQMLTSLDGAMDQIAADGPVERAYAFVDLANGMLTSDPALNRPLINFMMSLADPMRDPPVVQHAIKINRLIFHQGVDEGYFIDHDTANLMAAQAYLTYSNALRLWSWGYIDEAEFRAQTICGATLSMLAMAADSVRPVLLARLERLRPTLENAYPAKAPDDGGPPAKAPSAPKTEAATVG